LLQLSAILVSKYHLPLPDAEVATAKFLQSFVLCPHNPDYDIAEWRILLWSQALKEYACKAGKFIYILYVHDIRNKWLLKAHAKVQ
jgi:histidinol phosphatase-like enzyme